MSVYSPFEKQVWDYFMDPSRINNPYGVAALMGNMVAESGIYAGRLQGDFTNNYAPSAAYTQALNAGNISEYNFVTTKYYTYNGVTYGPAYGLCQWDYSPRRQNYWNQWHGGAYNAGSLFFECEFCWWELNNGYTGVRDTLINATNIRAASDVVLAQYENPAVQTEAVKEQRASFGENIYTEYVGTPPGPGPDPDPEYPGITGPWAAVLWYITRRANDALVLSKELYRWLK